MEYIDPEQELIQQSENQLLLHESEESKTEAELTKNAEDQAIADAKRKLVDYQDLQSQPSFQLFLRDIQAQIDAEFTAMEATTDPIQLAKRTGAYCALNRIKGHTAREIAEASLFLRAQKR